MMISIDIEEMQQIAAMLNIVKEKIDDSANTVSRITEHNDWQCHERVAINQKIIKNKKEQKKLQEKFSVFSEKITIAASQFSEIDAKTLTAFRDLNALFSRLLSIPSSVSKGNTTTLQFGATISSIRNTNVNDQLSSYTLGGINEPIRVCQFESILIDNKGGN